MNPTLQTPVDPAAPIDQIRLPADQPAGMGSVAPLAADDTDLIEPEWVDAVKKLMAQFRDDPYKLAQAMTTLREDYLMKRYSRHIESTE